ncbi:MAG: hypothetical protein IIC96_11125, partial [Chloroflexi bacterium]|nr:hypothetical protein [Chloroflexota bacterium]
MVQPQQTHRPPLRSVLEAHVTVTAATYTAKAGDRVIGVNHTGAVTLTFPTAQLRSGRTYTVKDESGAAATNNITVATEGPETIDGSATDTISENYGSKTYYSDGTNWFTVPLLAPPSHTLASHSARAHSDLTGVGTRDHHAQAHQADHNSAGADALKLDDLAAPDDNTDLDFSTTKHGLTPKGTNTGNFLKDDGSWAAASGSDISARVHHSTTQSIANNTLIALVLNNERFDTDGMHFTSASNLTGTVTKTNGSPTLAGSGTQFTSELTVGQMITVPGTDDEVRGVTAIATDTSLTVNSNFANSASFMPQLYKDGYVLAASQDLVELSPSHPCTVVPSATTSRHTHSTIKHSTMGSTQWTISRMIVMLEI